MLRRYPLDQIRIYFCCVNIDEYSYEVIVCNCVVIHSCSALASINQDITDHHFEQNKH